MVSGIAAAGENFHARSFSCRIGITYRSVGSIRSMRVFCGGCPRIRPEKPLPAGLWIPNPRIRALQGLLIEKPQIR